MNLLRKAHDYMQEHGWTQGILWDDSGQVCLLGAVSRVSTHSRPNYFEESHAYDAMGAVCAEQYGTDRISVVNDKYVTSKEEALTILDKAAVLLDERLDS